MMMKIIRAKNENKIVIFFHFDDCKCFLYKSINNRLTSNRIAVVHDDDDEYSTKHQNKIEMMAREKKKVKCIL